MNVLITGGAGYIGCCMAEKLALMPNVQKIGIYDNFTRHNYLQVMRLKKIYGDKIDVFVGDILDGHKLKRILKHFSKIVHLAAVTGTPFNDEAPHLYEQVNHWGTASLVNIIDELDNIESIIYLSSATVYGVGAHSYGSASPVNPVNNYGKTKLAAEKQINRLKNKIQVSIFRAGTVYGLTDSTRFDSFINKFLFKAITGDKIAIYGSGEQIRPVVHVNEVVNTLMQRLVTEKNQPLSNINQYNLSVNEVAGVIRSIFPKAEYVHVNREVTFRTLSIEVSGGNASEQYVLDEFKNSLLHDISSQLK
jgi:UDP-glucose 4-epimerase